MSMKKNGNKEAKKPKKDKPIVHPDANARVAEVVALGSSDRVKKKR
jgi:hypothetical protein